ncbi:MAG: hypothetical protein AAF487_00180 [Bacteroidota bacterium]
MVRIVFILLFLIGINDTGLAEKANVQEYYTHIHLAEKHLLSDSFEAAYYSYQDAFTYLDPFAIDLFNAACAMLYSDPDPQVFCDWNSHYFQQTGISIVELLKRSDRRNGSDFMAKLTPDNWLDIEVCKAEKDKSLQDELFEILMNDSLFGMNWEYENGELNYIAGSPHIVNNKYAVYNILPLNRFLIAKRFNEQDAGQWVMDLIENILKENLNLNVGPIIRGMKYKVQQGEIDNRFFSRLCDHMVLHSFKLRKELTIDESQLYFTHHINYDSLETYVNMQSDILQEVNTNRFEIFLFDYQSSIERIQYFRNNRLFFPYHQSIFWPSMDEKGMNRILQKVDKGELSLFD